MILIDNLWGLGNQIKNLVSALRLADISKDAISITQPHEHIFTFNNIYPAREEIRKYSTWMLDRHCAEEDFNMLKVYREFVIACDGFFYMHHALDFQFNNIKDEVIDEYKKYFKRIIFAPEILDAVKQFTASHPKFIGVHIRTWRDDHWRKKHLHDLDLFKRFMDQYQDIPFFLSTDDIEVIQDLELSYPGRILFYPKELVPKHTSHDQNPKLAIEAIIEILLLSKSIEIIGTYESTFTECAWWLAEGRPTIHIPIPPSIAHYQDPRNYLKNNIAALRPEQGSFTAHDLERLVKTSHPVILEIGANGGSLTKDLLHHLPNARIISFEPDPRAIQKFKSNINSPNVQLIESAVGSSNGLVNFYQSDGENELAEWDKSGSIRKPKNHFSIYPMVKFKEPIKLPIISLDEWAGLKGIDHIDCIWIQAPGAEADIILGATQVLKKTHILCTNYSNNELYEGQIDIKKLDSLLPEFYSSRLFHQDVLFENIEFKKD